jgi:hypothetical protein
MKGFHYLYAGCLVSLVLLVLLIAIYITTGGR